MAEISIRMAESDDDFEAARALCREWLDWHWNAYPEDWPTEGNPMDREAFQETLNNLPALHARPRGAILIASLDSRPVGCVMYSEADAETAEFNRMFVSEGGRGHGLGQRILERMFEDMIADGYRRVMFSSAKFLTHAKRLYQSLGFSDMPHPPGFPDQWRDYVYFMERPLP